MIFYFDDKLLQMIYGSALIAYSVLRNLLNRFMKENEGEWREVVRNSEK